MREGMATEVDICREFVTPRLEEGNKATLQDQPHTLKAEQQALEQSAKVAKAEGDNMYWPSYNLDINNPHARAGLEHAAPKDLIGAMPSHEADVMRLLGEIAALVAEVQG